jgi:hypothetical protein
MRRKAVVKRLESIARLRLRLKAVRREVDRCLRGRPASPADDGTLALLDLCELELIVVERRLADAEDAYAQAKAKATALRRERNQTAAELRDRHEKGRRWVQSVYGDRHVVDSAPSQPHALARHVRLTLSRLRALGRRPETIFPGVSIDPSFFVADLEPRVEALESVLEQLEAALVGVIVAQEEAERAMAAAGRAVTSVAGLSEALRGLARTACIGHER